jgi:hypothetical protein
MKFKKIVGFGDSWMFGDELIDPALQAQEPNIHFSDRRNVTYREQHCFLGLLAEHYGCPQINLGIPGGSLDSTVWSYLWWLEQEPDPQHCMVIVFLTESNRSSFYNAVRRFEREGPPWKRFVHSTWVCSDSPSVTSEFREMIRNHLVLTDSLGIQKLRYRQTVLFFEGQHKAFQIPLLMFNAFESPQTVTNSSALVWPEFDWATYINTHPQNQNRQWLCEGGHPNEIGHGIIRDMLIPEIDRVILAE